MGGAGEKSMEGLLPNVSAGSTVERGALGSFTATTRTETNAVVENTLRNAARTTINVAAQTATGAAGNAAKDAPQTSPPPPPAPKPPASPCPTGQTCHQ
jgi:hypothetical protein